MVYATARCLRLSLFTIFMTACSTVAPVCPTAPTGDIVYVVGQGWHAEIAVPVEELDSNLHFFRDLFSGARVLMFGYGKKTFFTAPAHSLSEYMLGPIPGPAVIHAVGLRVTPLEAYPPEDTVTLTLPPGGSHALSEYLWNDLVKGIDGKPIIVAHSSSPDGLFYAAESEYNLLHTCNAWTVEALQAAGLPLSDGDVVFEHQAMNRVNQVAESQCRQ
jgi:hypothetical protein